MRRESRPFARRRLSCLRAASAGCQIARMKWGSALSVQAETALAVSEAAAKVHEALEGSSADLVVVFAAPQHREALYRLPRLVQAEFPGALVFGCTGGGIVGGGGSLENDTREIERQVALSLTAASLPGVRLQPFHFELDQGPQTPVAWQERLGTAPQHFLLLPDPFSCDIEQLLGALDSAYPTANKVGGVASGGRGPGGNALFLDDEVHRSGVIGLALSGDLAMDTLVAQGCRPIGTPLITTRCENNLLLELNGQPALQVLRELFESLSTDEKELFRSSLFLGTQMKDDQLEYHQGDFLIRNLMGLLPERNAVVVGAQLVPYQAVQFHLRDANTSAEDLRQHLKAQIQRNQKQGAKHVGGLLFSCLGRGEGLYGVPDHDSRLIQEFLGPLPLGGFFCNGEIGPVGDQTFLHGYTSSVALFRPRTG